MQMVDVFAVVAALQMLCGAVLWLVFSVLSWSTPAAAFTAGQVGAILGGFIAGMLTKKNLDHG